MTLSLYRENKIIDKWLNGGQIKTIAFEEKVCAETVRRCLKRNNEKTGYKHGRVINENGSVKKNNASFAAGGCSGDENLVMDYTKKNKNIDGEKMMTGLDDQQYSSDVD